MAQVRLHRTDDQWTFDRAILSEHCIQRLELDRIAKRRAGAVRFDVTDRSRIHARGAQRLAEERLLRNAIRHGEAARRAVLIDRRAPNHRENAIAVGLSV